MNLNSELDKILDFQKIYTLKKVKKTEHLTNYFNLLTKHHYQNCSNYRNILNKFNYSPQKKYKINDLPFIPVSIFKNLSLSSIKKGEISRIMYSSGTTGAKKSKIFLDKKNSINQIKALNKVFYEMTELKNQRLPMLIIDKNIINNKNEAFSARAAAITGFSIFSSERVYALNDDMSLNYLTIQSFLKKNEGKQKLIFGLTALIWENFLKDKKLRDLKLNFKNTIMLHGGGWKKLEDKKINNSIFKNEIKKILNIDFIINYYGMIEQTGSIFFECEKCNNFVTSIYSDIIIRDTYLNDAGFHKKGMIQLLSVLPTSYPGHNILTEDIGMILGEDDCVCGKMGKRFKVFGRLKKSEVRGCSDAIS